MSTDPLTREIRRQMAEPVSIDDDGNVLTNLDMLRRTLRQLAAGVNRVTDPDNPGKFTDLPVSRRDRQEAKRLLARMGWKP